MPLTHKPNVTLAHCLIAIPKPNLRTKHIQIYTHTHNVTSTWIILTRYNWQTYIYQNWQIVSVVRSTNLGHEDLLNRARFLGQINLLSSSFLFLFFRSTFFFECVPLFTRQKWKKMEFHLAHTMFTGLKIIADRIKLSEMNRNHHVLWTELN